MRGRLKRFMDVTIAVAAMPVAAPIMGLAAACIRLESAGSPIFVQTRLGLNGREFRMFKLRTMVVGAERLGAGLYSEANDPRFTRVGVVLRKFSIDELPQLLNVLKGDMSVVGPRPMIREVVEAYESEYREILRVRPGLTGLAQVSGRSELPRSMRLTLDREYASSWSLRGDLVLLLRTVGVVLSGEGHRSDRLPADVER